MHYNHNYNTPSNNTLHRPSQTQRMASNRLVFEQPQELVLESGLVVWDIKPKKPKRSYRISRPVSNNLEITEINIYTEQRSLGRAWQGELIAPMRITDSTSGTATHYRVRNIWLELIRHQSGQYAFRIQAAFMVPLPEVVYLYQQNSLIVVNENMVKYNM